MSYDKMDSVEAIPHPMDSWTLGVICKVELKHITFSSHFMTPSHAETTLATLSSNAASSLTVSPSDLVTSFVVSSSSVAWCECFEDHLESYAQRGVVQWLEVCLWRAASLAVESVTWPPTQSEDAIRWVVTDCNWDVVNVKLHLLASEAKWLNQGCRLGSGRGRIGGKAPSPHAVISIPLQPLLNRDHPQVSMTASQSQPPPSERWDAFLVPSSPKSTLYFVLLPPASICSGEHHCYHML